MTTTDKIIKNLRKTYSASWVRKKHGGGMGHAGDPDIHACIRGRFVGIEVKKVGEPVSRIQQLTLARIVSAGGIAFIATSWDQVVEALEMNGIPQKIP